ncbi:MAG: hypothetical protein GX978_07350 [Tissierellia bacterium]|jgi:hypothetical protein|nr:hypothetical protein [Tissierellia bacterium]
MFAPKRLERAYKYSREQAEQRNHGIKPEEDLTELEKGDLSGMMFGAFVVFAPVFLVLLALIILAFVFL